MPRKNILELAGKPLIAYTIEAGLNASHIDRVVVSTEDVEIARVAREYGGEVPFLRPHDLARDDTPVYPVLVHAIQWLKRQEGYQPDYVMLLQPTSPLRTVEDIELAVNIANNAEADGVVSVNLVHQHPYWMKQITEDGRLTNYLSLDHVPDRRQELPQVYIVNGAIYLAETTMLLERQTFYTDRTYVYIMPLERSLDIDSKWDLYLAELILEDRIRHAKN